jgi:DNA-binding response OmpR family regulator
LATAWLCCHRPSSIIVHVATRILAIEDDADLRALLRMILEDEDFDVIEADDGTSGLALADASVDLVLLDVKLPDIGGFEVCRQLRARSGIPIVMVTAQIDSYDMVAGLSAGADDYVTKPFIPKVLVARIRALLRRVQANNDEAGRLSCGDLEIAPREGFAARGGVNLQLTKTEFRLLCDMAEHQGRVFSRELLLQRVWGYDYAGDGRLVDSHIRRLRTKVEEDPANPTRIVTVRGLGYKFVCQ